MADHVIEHSDSSASMALAIGAILLVVAVLFFLFGGSSLFRGVGNTIPSNSTTEGQGGSINVDVPEEINVNTN